MEKVYYKKSRNGELCASGKQDISYEEEDIATLAGTKLMTPYDEYEDPNIRKARVSKKIEQSSKKRGCYEYSQMENPNVER